MRNVIRHVLIAACGVVLAGAGLTAQAPAAAKNLQVLTPDVNLLRVMRGFDAALGVQCTYCHVPNDFAGESNPKKAIARTMLRMLKEQINVHFPDAGNDFLNSRYLPFPEGKQYVTCYTCHRGAPIPANTLTNWHGPDRAPEPGSPPPAGRGRTGANGPAGGGARGAAAADRQTAADTDAIPPTRGTQMHKNMVYLPSNVNTQFVMPAFRAAIGVECNFCHVAGAQMERGHANERDFDTPEKLIARNMIGMMQQINAAVFPGTDVDIALLAASSPPAGTHYVTCYTCHRGTRVPATDPPASR